MSIVYQLIFCFGTVILADSIYWLLAGRLDVRGSKSSGRWFFIHIWINSVVTIFSFSDTIKCITQPLECSITPWSSNLPIVMGISGHLYHLIAFKVVSFDDYIHHFLMVFFCGFVSSYIGTIGINSAIFFMTGLPGLLDYVLLVLSKFRFIESIVEKKSNVIIQIYFRMPCLVFVGSITYASSIANNNTLSYVVLIGLCFVNGIYYMHDTVSNYYSKHGKN